MCSPLPTYPSDRAPRLRSLHLTVETTAYRSSARFQQVLLAVFWAFLRRNLSLRFMEEPRDFEFMSFAWLGT